MLAPQDADGERLTDRLARHQTLDLVDSLDRPTVELEDQGPGPQAGALSGAAVNDLDDLDAILAPDPRPRLWWEWTRAARDPDVGAPHATLGHQRADDLSGGGVDRDRQAG